MSGGSKPTNPVSGPGSTVPVKSATVPCPTPTTYGESISLDGDDEFRKKTIQALDDIKKTKSGKALLDSIEKSGKKVKITKTDNGNTENADSFEDGLITKDGKAGSGSNSTVKFNPDRVQIGDGSEKWMKRPASVGLAHELIHSAHDANGTTEYDYSDKTKNPQNYEIQTVGLKGTNNGKPVDYAENTFTENKIRKEMGEPLRPNY